MLNVNSHRHPAPRRTHGAHRQTGIVMVLALIVLVALTLASVALVRSVATSNTIAGNLAFQQAATHAADLGIEAAITWLENNSGQPSSPNGTASACSTGSTVLACDQAARGYIAHRQDPDPAASPPQTWAAFWNSLQEAGRTFQLPAVNNNGNAVSYVIQRMCSNPGDASAMSNSCSAGPAAVAGTCAGGSSCAGGGGPNLNGTSQIYYRITVEVTGPRHTQSLVQAVVAL
jgi:type IV pilus assembly protein PilX